MLWAAYRADPHDCLIGPVGKHAYSTLFALFPLPLALLRVAAEIEKEPAAVIEGYRHERIRELGDLAAEQLVALGRVEAVKEFLYEVRDERRN